MRIRPRRAALLLACTGVGIGVGGAVVWQSVRTSPTSVVPAASVEQTPAGPSIPANRPPAVARPVRAGSAPAAVEAFLAAQAAGQPEQSYEVLDRLSRDRFGSAAAWVQDQANRAEVVSFTLEGDRPVATRADAVDVEVVIDQRPALDPFVGFVPGRTRNLVRAVREGEEWRVLPDPVDTEALLPPDGRAAVAVQSWLDAMSRCDRRTAQRFTVDSAIVGPAFLPRQVCDERGPWKAGVVRSTDDAPSIADLVSAYGPDVPQWARLVPVEGGKSRFLVAVAPIGDEWRVFGAIASGAERGAPAQN